MNGLFHLYIILILRTFDRLSFQLGDNLILEREGRFVHCMPRHGNSFLVAKEFSEVPLDCVRDKSRLLVFQIFPKRVSITSININFGKHRKGHTIFASCEFLYLFICPWFLISKLITGKCQHLKPLIMILIVQLHELGV